MPKGRQRAAIIVTGGSTAPSAEVVAHLPVDAFVIAADSGFDHAVALRLNVDLLLGDLDSISADGLASAVDSRVMVQQFPQGKDETDTELAIAAALDAECSEIIGISGGGGRLDHELTTLFAFAAIDRCPVTVWSGTTLVRVLIGPGTLQIERTAAGLVSLVPVHGDAAGVTTSRLRYRLVDETLRAGSARGTSNEFTAADAAVSLRSGTLLVIVPDATDNPFADGHLTERNDTDRHVNEGTTP